MEIWINPRCSKCRTALEFLDSAGAEYTVRRYLDDPPSVAELRTVLGGLDLEPWHITRTGEPIAKELGITKWGKDGEADRERWIAALAEHPELIQRPIIHGRRRSRRRRPQRGRPARSGRTAGGVGAGQGQRLGGSEPCLSDCRRRSGRTPGCPR